MTRLFAKKSARAFTLIELLVVVAIIGVLIALLLPAVQSARESARRTQCLNNLKQLALAVHHCHQTHGTMPTYWGKFPDKGQGAVNAGWTTHLLPYLEQNNLHDQITAGGGGMGSTTVLVTPASPDYEPGHWEYPPGGHWEIIRGGTTIDEDTDHQGHRYPRTRTEPDRRVWVGDPPVWVPGRGTPPVYETTNKGIDNAAGQIFKRLQCVSDPSTVQPGTMVNFRYSQPWSLSNYLANFRVLASDEKKAKPARFTEVTDGLTQTVLFAEGMRYCDRSYRFALWNDYAFQHSHNFTVDWNGHTNTYMFQSVPHHRKCNNWRVQGLHYGNLNVALLDGSVRPLLRHISHLETSDPDNPGWGVDPEMGTGPIGTWDQLLLPTDGETVGQL